MKKSGNCKLAVNRETIRALATVDLARAVGGLYDSDADVCLQRAVVNTADADTACQIVADPARRP
jgi:hypothetical protein